MSARVGVRRRGAGLARAAVAAALVVTAVAGPALAPAPVDARAGACPTGSGVTVVVDFGGGDVAVRCAPGTPGSGLAALSAAGYGYGFVPNLPGFVCTIAGRPDPCNGGPPDAYWSYWHAPAGGSWTYASVGAGSRRPPAGTVEGWAFGAGAPPAVAPPAPPATTTTAPPPPPPSTTTTASPSPTTPPTTTGTTETTTAPTAAPATTTPPTAPTTVAGDVGGTTATTRSTDPDPTAGETTSTTTETTTPPTAPPGDAVDGDLLAAPGDDGTGGSSAGTGAGLVAVAALGGTAAWVALRRRSTER